MDPAEIRSLLEQAKALRQSSPSGIHTFALYWITWEAYRTRMLAVAIRLRGWRVADAYSAIGCKKISTQRTYRQCFKAATNVQLAETRGLTASVFNHLDTIESLRHRLIHGYRSANPTLIQSANDFLDAILTHHEKIFSQLEIPAQNGSLVRLGNVLAPRPASGRGITIQLEPDLLHQQFELTESHKPGKLPDRSNIESWQKIVQRLKL